MNRLNEWLDTCRPTGGEHLLVAEGATPYAVVDPVRLEVEVPAGVAGRLVVAYRTEATTPSEVRITLHQGAQLTLTELFGASVRSSLTLIQEGDTFCRTTALLLAGAQLECRTELHGAHTETDLQGLFVLGGEEQGGITLHTRHLVADGKSNSVVKGVAGGNASGRFAGLVYVAQDAQRTDARQQSRNILLTPAARIDTLPQLEIYADDVQCSHGASVGQMDDEAIYYMRQRGLSEATARRLQMEGFAGEVVHHCADEELADILIQAVSDKLERV